MKVLKDYQEDARDSLYKYIEDLLEKENKTGKVILKAPTGAGKTFVATKLIEKLGREIQDKDLTFIWISIGKGNLQQQSYFSVKRDISDLIKCELLDDNYIGTKESLGENEVLFLNWEKINWKNENGEWTNKLMKERELVNLPSILEKTKENGNKIILIIDESHYAADSENSIELINTIIKPNVILEMSATPLIKEYDMMKKIEPMDVIKSGMIKNEIIINQDLEEVYSIEDELTSEELVLEAAYRKRKELEEKYIKQGENIVPLVLIQIPNSDLGRDKKEIIEKFFEKKGINYENGLYAWLEDEDKTKITFQERMNKILPNDSNIKFLIFKQAIDTGWDCPRAEILVKFRETKSLTFEIQTLGRILRMPNAKHYNDEELNKAYVYTNIQSIKVKKEEYNPNIIKSLYSNRSDCYGNVKLTSFYKKRGNQGDIAANFYSYFERFFCKYFNIELNTLAPYADNYKKIKEKGIIFDDKVEYSLIQNGEIPSYVIDEIKKEEFDKGSTFGIKISKNDLQYKFEEILIENLNGFPKVRSLPTIKQSIFITLKKHLNLNIANGGAIFIQNFIVNNKKIFSQILDSSIKEYKKDMQSAKDDKILEKVNEDWEVPVKKYFNDQTWHEVKNVQLSLYQPFYVENATNSLEMKFIDYLQENYEKINWFWKNGSDDVETNFGIKIPETEKTFRPDFIVSFKDGRIGIFDTKGGQYYDDDKNKSNALSLYIVNERNRKNRNVFGGLVILDDNKFRIFTHDNFESFKENPNRWEYMDNLL